MFVRESERVSKRKRKTTHSYSIIRNVIAYLTNKTLERQLADEQVGTLLVTTNLTKSDRSRAITVGLLDTSRSRSRLAGSLGGQLLTGSFSASGFTSCLLGTSHDDR